MATKVERPSDDLIKHLLCCFINNELASKNASDEEIIVEAEELLEVQRELIEVELQEKHPLLYDIMYEGPAIKGSDIEFIEESPEAEDDVSGSPDV